MLTWQGEGIKRFGNFVTGSGRGDAPVSRDSTQPPREGRRKEGEFIKEIPLQAR